MYYGSADILQVTCFPGCLWPVPLNSFGLHCASVRQSSSFFLWRGTCCHGQINSKPGFCTSCPRVALHVAGVQFWQDFTFEKTKNWLWHPTPLKWENRWDRFGQGRLCSTACYSRQRTSTATSKWDIIAWTCLDKRIRKVDQFVVFDMPFPTFFPIDSLTKRNTLSTEGPWSFHAGGRLWGHSHDNVWSRWAPVNSLRMR